MCKKYETTQLEEFIRFKEWFLTEPLLCKIELDLNPCPAFAAFFSGADTDAASLPACFPRGSPGTGPEPSLHRETTSGPPECYEGKVWGSALYQGGS